MKTLPKTKSGNDGKAQKVFETAACTVHVGYCFEQLPVSAEMMGRCLH